MRALVAVAAAAALALAGCGGRRHRGQEGGREHEGRGRGDPDRRRGAALPRRGEGLLQGREAERRTQADPGRRGGGAGRDRERDPVRVRQRDLAAPGQAARDRPAHRQRGRPGRLVRQGLDQRNAGQEGQLDQERQGPGGQDRRREHAEQPGRRVHAGGAGEPGRRPVQAEVRGGPLPRHAGRAGPRLGGRGVDPGAVRQPGPGPGRDQALRPVRGGPRAADAGGVLRLGQVPGRQRRRGEALRARHEQVAGLRPVPRGRGAQDHPHLLGHPQAGGGQDAAALLDVEAERGLRPPAGRAGEEVQGASRATRRPTRSCPSKGGS